MWELGEWTHNFLGEGFLKLVIHDKIRYPFGCRPHGETNRQTFIHKWWSKPKQGRMFSIGCDPWELLYWINIRSYGEFLPIFLKINTKWVCFQTCGLKNRSKIVKLSTTKDALIYIKKGHIKIKLQMLNTIFFKLLPCLLCFIV